MLTVWREEFLELNDSVSYRTCFLRQSMIGGEGGGGSGAK